MTKINNSENENKLKKYKLITFVKCISLDKAYYCLKIMLEALDKESIWHMSRLPTKEIPEIKKNKNEVINNIISELDRLIFITSSDKDSKALRMMLEKELRGL
jgi:hypothetical protein